MKLQLLFGFIGVFLSFLLIFIALKKQSVQQSKAVVFLVLAVTTFLAALLNFIPTTSANNIRVDLVLIDFMFYPILVIVVIANLFSIRKVTNNCKNRK